MNKVLAHTVVTSLAILSLASDATMQSGGGFEITEAVVANGGGSSSAVGIELEATLAQPISGDRSGSGIFSLTSGFWNYNSLGPTAALASISGRVLNAAGIGVNNAILYLQTQEGEMFITRSSSFGYYMFDGIAVGQTVFITVEHKRFTFEPRSVTLADVVTDLDFIAQ